MLEVGDDLGKWRGRRRVYAVSGRERRVNMSSGKGEEENVVGVRAGKKAGRRKGRAGGKGVVGVGGRGGRGSEGEGREEQE